MLIIYEDYCDVFLGMIFYLDGGFFNLIVFLIGWMFSLELFVYLMSIMIWKNIILF